MECYHVEVKNVDSFKVYLKHNYKVYTIWEPPADLFKSCVFVMTDEPIRDGGRFKFELLTPDLYRTITEDSVGVVPPIKPKDVIKVKDKVKVISPAFSFKGIVNSIKDGLICVVGKAFEGKKSKKIELTVPEDYVEKITRRKNKK